MIPCPNCGTAIPDERIVDRADARPYAECPDCWEVHPVSARRENGVVDTSRQPRADDASP